MTVSIVKADNYKQDTVKNALKHAFSLLGLDTENPFKHLVQPGDRVFIKPNWVAHRYRASCPFQYDIYTTITHPSIIKEIARFVDVALAGDGSITIGDNPSIDADFDELAKLQAIEELAFELNTPLEICDLRPLVCTDLKYYGQKAKMKKKPGDPRGETLINLKERSQLAGFNPRLFRGVFNEREETVKAHSGVDHLYSISNSIFKADVLISIPKLKTHHKVGTTLNLKGLVGALGTKNYLVHWREGFPLVGGDAYPNFWHWFKDKFKKVKKRGAWSGNDTIWRMVVDLYTLLEQGPNRRFSIIDGILGGEGDGPFCPKPNDSKVLLMGNDFLETDIVASRLMGFNVEKIPYLYHYLSSGKINKDKIEIKSDHIDIDYFFDLQNKHLSFEPPTHWQHLM